MLCYRDRTFCKFRDCKKFTTCHRALTEDIEKVAEDFGLPIAKFVDKPECFEDKES
jgi:hypothetical protein